ncbi:MAG: membrane lipoprotein lipid attachment site-containing protein [Clostridia bacterium]|nr:membrane lipoprotein lipid attachment site-containing protein [Clostridia bacterium]
MKKILTLITAVLILSSCTAQPPEKTPATTSQAPVSTTAPAKTEAAKKVSFTPVESGTESKADTMTEAASVDTELLSEEDMDTITLYTSAKKENGKFVRDDSEEWLLEIEGADGKYYTLFDERVSNGNIYFDVAEVGEKKYILLHNISTAADYIKVFCVNDKAVCETNELDLNSMQTEAINLIYTSIPNYR